MKWACKIFLLGLGHLTVDSNPLAAQPAQFKIKILDLETQKAIPFGQILTLPDKKTYSGDTLGRFFIPKSTENPKKLVVVAPGYKTDTFSIGKRTYVEIHLQPKEQQLKEVVVSGNMQEVQRMESTSSIELYTPVLFRKTWNPSLLESVNMINGVQPQLNCNVCNTGDIHINGLEGPYTLVLIDGMPIVSSLSSVYGLSGIPQALIKRVEVVKGPASTLYGSEAMGGLINVITQDPISAPLGKVEVSATSLGEMNIDLATKFMSKNVQSFLGINAFNYSSPKDRNGDNFTDLALAKRISIFSKTTFDRKSDLKSTVAFRIYGEDRWGGEMNWTPKWQGSDSIYGESVKTNRLEAFGNHEFTPTINLNFAYNSHIQNSYYGKVRYQANQQTAFAQLLWKKEINGISWLAGLPLRFTQYDDNSVATEKSINGKIQNEPSNTWLPGLFVQADSKINNSISLLTGIRFDWHSIHGSIFTPRVAIKYRWLEHNTLRLSAGTGYRVVNLFTEDHAALSGSRTVIIKNELKPEKSWNINLNYSRFINIPRGFANLDLGVFFTQFSNQIVGDFMTNSNQIIYDNLNGFGVSRGINANLDARWENGWSTMLGASAMDVFRMEDQSDGKAVKQIQLFAPNFSGTFSVSYRKPGSSWNFDVSGKVNGPMKLPVLLNDFRPEYSPTYTLLNAQVTKRLNRGFEFFFGGKNLLNFIPKNPLMRPFDPFNKRTDENNPNGYRFDTAYNYAPIQGVTAYAGIRWTIQ